MFVSLLLESRLGGAAVVGRGDLELIWISCSEIKSIHIFTAACISPVNDPERVAYLNLYLPLYSSEIHNSL